MCYAMGIFMGISYNEKNRVFKLDTPKSTYMFGILDDENFVGHIYYGRKVIDSGLEYLIRVNKPSLLPSQNNRDRVNFLDALPMEYSTHGIGDFREACFSVRSKGGHSACSLSYVSHKIYKGKPELNSLPATFGEEGDCTTLELMCEDKSLKLFVTLLYTAFENLDVITRSVKVANASGDPVYLNRVLSACLDMDNKD